MALRYPRLLAVEKSQVKRGKRSGAAGAPGPLNWSSYRSGHQSPVSRQYGVASVLRSQCDTAPRPSGRRKLRETRPECVRCFFLKKEECRRPTLSGVNNPREGRYPSSNRIETQWPHCERRRSAVNADDETARARQSLLRTSAVQGRVLRRKAGGNRVDPPLQTVRSEAPPATLNATGHNPLAEVQADRRTRCPSGG
jgi:hypothetical protein